MAAQDDDDGGRGPNLDYAIDLLRAFGGAVVFAFPLFMTMEMWSLGFSMDRPRLLLLLVLNVLILFGLSTVAGFRETFSLKEDALDAFAALGVGILASTALLALFGVVTWAMPSGEVVGKVALQAVPASIGAMAARGQLGDREEDQEQRDASYAGQLFLMMAGALFLAFNVAPTEEMVLISFQMTPWHGITLVVVSVAAIHAFLYSLEFSGQQERPGRGGFWRAFLSHSLVGYGIALAVSLYALWTFGRTDEVDAARIAMMVAVLGFPAALGAALARLVV